MEHEVDRREEAAEAMDEDDKFSIATLISTEDIGKSQGKPGQSLKRISNLMAAIECCIIHFEAFLMENGHHQKMVRRLRLIL